MILSMGPIQETGLYISRDWFLHVVKLCRNGVLKEWQFWHYGLRHRNMEKYLRSRC